jgi:hypothetical protein
MRNLHRLSAAVFILAGTLALAPTASAQRRPPHGPHAIVHHPGARSDDGSITVAPPPTPQVVRPPRPFPGAVWTDGYWSWNGRAHVWVDGTWMRPMPGRRWSPWRWELTQGRWVLIPGGWVPSHDGHL